MGINPKIIKFQIDETLTNCVASSVGIYNVPSGKPAGSGIFASNPT
jgi:hypothetical protein